MMSGLESLKKMFMLNKKTLQPGFIGLSFTVYGALVQASGFSLYNEINGSAVGNYAAGIAAEYNDASTGWTNPAGLAFIHHEQTQLGVVGVFPSASLSGQTLYTTPTPIGNYDYEQSFKNLTTSEQAAIPSFHFARPIGPNSAVAFSLVMPYGLASDWDQNSAVRYAATRSELLTLDFSPEIGGRITDYLTAGVGFDFEEARVTFNQILGAPAILDASGENPALLDSYSSNQGYSFGLGFHAGLLLHTQNQRSRLGLNFQSAVNHQFRGTSTLTGPLAAASFNVFDTTTFNSQASYSSGQLYSNAVDLPSVTTLSFYQSLHPQWALLGSMVYTNWSSIDTIELHNVAAPNVDETTGDATQSYKTGINPSDYRNTWRVALGANYQYNEKLMLRAGTGYEQTPTINAERDVRLPDANRIALAIGGHYQYSSRLGFDAGYSHYFMDKLQLNKTNQLDINTFNVQATGHARADLFGGQFVYKFD
jgi:long-chain fatty acid transport protein